MTPATIAMLNPDITYKHYDVPFVLNVQLLVVPVT